MALALDGTLTKIRVNTASAHTPTDAPGKHLMMLHVVGPDAMNLLHRLFQSTRPSDSEPKDDLSLCFDVPAGDVFDNSSKDLGGAR